MVVTAQKEKQSIDRLVTVLVFALIISVMNSTMFNIAIPSITKEFKLLPTEAGWIVTAYIIIYAIGSVIYGKLADKFMLKTLLTFGLLTFAAGSILGFTASSFPLLVAGRCLQAMGASVMPTVSMIIPTRYFNNETRGRVLGLTSAGMALGTAIGPIAAGFVTSFFNWHYLFVVSLLSLVTLPFFRKYLQEEKQHQDGKIDLFGAAFLAGTLAFLLLAITQSSIWFAALCGLFSGLFIWRILKARDPFVQISLFKNKQFSLGIVISGICSGIGFGIPYLTPLLLQDVNGLSPILSGLYMFPSAMLAACLGRSGGKLADLKGNHVLTYIALLSFFVGYSILSIVAGLSPFIIMFVLMFACIGQTFMQISLSNTVSSTLIKADVGVGMGILMMTNFISGALFTTLMSKALEKGSLMVQLNPLLQTQDSLTYSNIYTVLTILIIIVTATYHFRFKSYSTVHG